MSWLRLALCQIDPVVGDLAGNAGRILDMVRSADAADADLALFPELALTGYPPEDLLLRAGFVEENLETARKLAAETGRCAAVFGFVDAGRDLHNALAIAARGEWLGTYHKELLPNYSVFDEQRYFAPGRGARALYDIAGVPVGLTICEDAWAPAGPVATQAAAGAALVLSANASPFAAGRRAERAAMLATRAADASACLAYCNAVGGQDELVFDGGSMVFDATGRMVAAAPQFEEALLLVDLEVRPVFRKRLLDPRGRATLPLLPVVGSGLPRRVGPRAPAPTPPVPLEGAAEVYEALVLGTGDYVRKNGFREVVVGLSGGVDSALVATVAADALGSDAVHTVAMPSRFSSQGSLDDAAELARRLGVDHRVVPIESLHVAFLEALAGDFGGRWPGLAEENLQSRIRGVLLMALSNALGWLVLTTGNKSELAVGYSTLYGDTAGGFDVLKDVGKTLVYELCRHRNRRGEGDGPIPVEILEKPPSAELRPDQRDDQSLPPYEILDELLAGYVEQDRTVAELVEAGHPAELVRRVAALVDAAEYKRRQSPPGVRVTAKAFGKDRRLPITNHFR